MPSPIFKGTHPKLDAATVCLATLTTAWENYVEARATCAGALLD